LTGEANFGEMSIFCQKAVARMDGFHIGNLGGGYDASDVKITFGRRPWSDAYGFISLLEIEGIAVNLGIHRHRLHPEFFAGPDNAQSNLTPIGYEYAREHRKIFSSGPEGYAGGI